jgi:CIC family chloride channel protein
MVTKTKLAEQSGKGHRSGVFHLVRALRQARAWLRKTWRSNRLFVYAVLVGVLGGVGAQIFMWMLEWGERIFMKGIAGYVPPPLGVVNPAPQFGPWTFWLIPLSTTLGGLICGFLVYSTAPEAEGHGTDAAIASYHYRGSRVRPIVPLIKAIASSITIGSGGAAGREGPAAQISSGAASILCDILRVPLAERRILVLAGMAAGLSAIFRAPLGMAIFASEILYAGMAFEYEALPYTLIASVVAYAVNGLFAGWHTLFIIPSGLTFARPVDLVGYAVLGVAAGVVGAIEPPVFYGLRDFFQQLRIPRHLKPAVGGLCMGLLAMAFPQTLATGFGWVEMALTGGFTGYTLLLLVCAKIAAMSLSVSSGGSGGVFGPNVYIGGMLGGGIAYTLNTWFPAAQFSPAAFVVVGMGAVFAGTARVPISTLIMVAEMTGGYGLIVPSMLASSLSFVVQRAVGGRFRYTRLYESQVETRVDSPVHHRRIAQGIFHLLEEGKALQTLGDIRLPDLSSLLRLDRPIHIHHGKGRLFSFQAMPNSPLLDFSPTNLQSSGADGLILVAVLREGDILAPADVDAFHEGDRLILAGPDQAYDAFMDAFGQPLRTATD